MSESLTLKKVIAKSIRNAVVQVFNNTSNILAFLQKRKRMKETICTAIGSKNLIEFYYRGGFRLVEPFCLGEIIPGDKESLLCYQVGGYDKFDDIIGWKLYRFSDMSKLTVIDEHFTGDRPGYDPDDLNMTTVYCRVIPTKDIEDKLKETVEVVHTTKKEDMSHEKSETHIVSSQIHNEQMKRFSITHSNLLRRLSSKQQ